ncbi:MAG: thioredoxin domain-containing protein, partial [Rhodospirillales bacterium]|nr:thioredoxin domain-containing protein [Rhodospirillales bacterium]
DNPVHWQVWSPETLAQAKKDKKPILLSIGYAACHWCHVMAHECFEDQAIATRMNQLFVNVKIDREERPDLDAIYQTALALMGTQGGWPLTMFLTPDGEPFWGGTYFPSAPNFERPSFPQILDTISSTYAKDPGRITNSVKSISQALEDISLPRTGQGSPPPPLEKVAALALPHYDPHHGGRWGTPKFPEIPLLTLMWRAHRKTGDEATGAIVRTTLDHICQGGIYDHLGGGFARYSTDEAWFAPHFEKMLYDNAQLLGLLSQVWLSNPNPLYEARITETIDWLGREMTMEGGAFAGSLDADSEGAEGLFYVWSAEEIDALLGPEADHFKTVYGVKTQGNWEGKNILHRLDALTWMGKGDEAVLTQSRDKLLAAREHRPRPGLDDKILTDWNGMMIQALTQAGEAMDRTDWLEAATRAYDFVTGHLYDSERLAHSWRHDQCRGGGVLDDYAQMAAAALVLFAATGQLSYLEEARQFTDTLDHHFWDEKNGGYFFTPVDAHDLITRSRTAQDGPSPSGNGIMTENLARLYHLTGIDAYRDRARQLVASFANRPEQEYTAFSTMIAGAGLLDDAIQAVIVGHHEEAATHKLRRAAIEAAQPSMVMQWLEPGAHLPAHHPAHGMAPQAPIPTAFVCYGNRCGPPLTDPADLKEALSGV